MQLAYEKRLFILEICLEIFIDKWVSEMCFSVSQYKKISCKDINEIRLSINFKSWVNLLCYYIFSLWGKFPIIKLEKYGKAEVESWSEIYSGTLKCTSTVFNVKLLQLHNAEAAALVFIGHEK